MRPILIAVISVIVLVSQTGCQDRIEDATSLPVCFHCRMNRLSYAHGRMLIQYDDGMTIGTCSIHCAALNLVVNTDKPPKEVLVADYYSKQLIDAETAYWVLGGAKHGVMTRKGKWAFGKKTDAEKLISANGGRLATFDDAMRATFQDMYTDTRMIRSKRRIRKMGTF